MWCCRMLLMKLDRRFRVVPVQSAVALAALLVCLCQAASAQTIPNYASVGYSEGGGMVLRPRTIRQIRKNSTDIQLVIGQADVAVDARPFLLEDKVGKGFRTFKVSESDFNKVWNLVEAAKLRDRKQISGEPAPTDSPRYILVVRWGNSPGNAQTKELAFFKGSQTYKEIEPVINALNGVSIK